MKALGCHLQEPGVAYLRGARLWWTASLTDRWKERTATYGWTR